jgi:hypothetical protein
MFLQSVDTISLRNILPATVLLCAALASQPAHAWEQDGHRMINKLAASNLPADVPAFLRSQAAIDEIEYLGPEPDRWRSRAEPELNAAQAPEHFIDFEAADALGPLPHKRLDFEAKVFAAGLRPEVIGLQPWETDEVWERLKAAMRQYRFMVAAGAGPNVATKPGANVDTKPVEAAILFYAGWLGHYVGDGSQPLHVTVQYNGWTGPNPNDYTTSHQIHHLFEGPFVTANMHAPEVQTKMTPVKLIQGDMFDAYVSYLRHTGTYVEKVYQFEKAGGFNGAGTPESRDFTAARLADGASMLRDMIYTAWVDSAQPVPERTAGQ